MYNKKSNNFIKSYFKGPIALIKALLNSKNIYGLILLGKAGIGKTYITINTLRAFGLKEKKHFIILTGYSTPLALYKFLYKYRKNKIIVLDDVSRIFRNKVARDILLSALWSNSPDGKRVIYYKSSSSHLDVPDNFTFNSKIICCLNEIPNDLDAIKSRCFYYQFKITHEEMILLMREVAKIKGIPQKIVDFIEKHTDATANVDLRLLIKVYDLYQTDRKNWQDLALNIIEFDEDKIAVIKALKKAKTIREAVKLFMEWTGKSRATFFRIKQKLVSKSHKKNYVYKKLKGGDVA